MCHEVLARDSGLRRHLYPFVGLLDERSAEHGAIDPSKAKQLVTAMDEVGARLSARLFRRAERLIDGAAGSTD